MKIFIDDVRECPDGWNLCRTAERAINLIDKQYAIISEISFDHDLGEGLTGYDVACFIEKQIFTGKMKHIPKWKIHSANPVGRQNIERAMKSAEIFVLRHF